MLTGCPFQDVMGKEGEEFVEFVSDTAYRCRSASTSLRVAVAMHMQQSACSFSKVPDKLHKLILFVIIVVSHN